MRGSAGHRVKEGGVQVTILDHEAHRAFLDLGGVEVEDEAGQRRSPATAVAGLDLQDRLRPCRPRRSQTPIAASSRREAIASA